MSAPCSPRWAHPSGPRRSPGYPDPGLRVSDAERAEAADRLSKHYGDGRLDQAEFNERLDRVMNAQTRAELSRVFTDLPGSEAAPVVARQQPGRRRHRVLWLVLIIVIAAAVAHVLVHSILPWLLIGLLAFLWLRHDASRRRRL
jgi:Flp pilus assembly protein TadB